MLESAMLQMATNLKEKLRNDFNSKESSLGTEPSKLPVDESPLLETDDTWVDDLDDLTKALEKEIISSHAVIEQQRNEIEKLRTDLAILSETNP